MAVKAYILIQAEPQANGGTLARMVARVPGVTRAEVVRGAYDVLAEVNDDSSASTTRAAVGTICEIAGVLQALPLRVVDVTEGATADAA